MRLQADPEFQRRIGADPVLAELFNPANERNQEIEDAQAMGMCQRIAGVDVPPVTMGHFRMLTAAGNAFAELKPNLSAGFSFQLEQFTEALFILHYGSRVLVPFTDIFRWRRALATWRKEVAANPALLAAIIEGERKLAEAMRPWDAAVLKFGERHVRLAPGETIEGAAELLGNWLAAAFSGFTLYPQNPDPEDAQKKTAGHGIPNWRVRLSHVFVSLARLSLRTKRDGRSP
jgi:hypothetical protein